MMVWPLFFLQNFVLFTQLGKRVNLQWCATLRPPTLRPVFKEIAKICHHKIFHFKAGFTIKFYFDSKFAIQLFKKARDFQLFFSLRAT